MIIGVRLHLNPGITGEAWIASRAPLYPLYQSSSAHEGSVVDHDNPADTVLMSEANTTDNNSTDPGQVPTPTALGDEVFRAQFNAYCESSLGMARHLLDLDLAIVPPDIVNSAAGNFPALWYYYWLIRQISNLLSPEQEQNWSGPAALVEGENELLISDFPFTLATQNPLYLAVQLTLGEGTRLDISTADTGNWGWFAELYGIPLGQGPSNITSGSKRWLNITNQRFKLVEM